MCKNGHDSHVNCFWCHSDLWLFYFFHLMLESKWFLTDSQYVTVVTEAWKHTLWSSVLWSTPSAIDNRLLMMIEMLPIHQCDSVIGDIWVVPTHKRGVEPYLKNTSTGKDISLDDVKTYVLNLWSLLYGFHRCHLIWSGSWFIHPVSSLLRV